MVDSKEAPEEESMPKKKKSKKIQDIAEQYMPGWKAVEKYRSDSGRANPADASVPNLAELKAKYFPQDSLVAASAEEDTDDDAQTGLVVMEEQLATDAHSRRKVLVVDKGKIKGAQG